MFFLVLPGALSQINLPVYPKSTPQNWTGTGDQV